MFQCLKKFKFLLLLSYDSHHQSIQIELISTRFSGRTQDKNHFWNRFFKVEGKREKAFLCLGMWREISFFFFCSEIILLFLPDFRLFVDCFAYLLNLQQIISFTWMVFHLSTIRRRIFQKENITYESKFFRRKILHEIIKKM